MRKIGHISIINHLISATLFWLSRMSARSRTRIAACAPAPVGLGRASSPAAQRRAAFFLPKRGEVRASTSERIGWSQGRSPSYRPRL